MCWTSTLLAIPALTILAFEFISSTRPDAHVRAAAEQVEDKTLEYISPNHARLRFSFPFHNPGTQQGLVIDASAHMQPVGLRYSDLRPVVKINHEFAPRTDGYWEAVIVKPNKKVRSQVEILLTAHDIKAAIADLGEFSVEVNFKYYCRTPMKYRHQVFNFNIKDFKEIPFEGIEKVSVEPPKKEIDPNATAIPVSTPLLMPGDNIVETVKKYTKDIAKPGDIIALAESPVAIMQGRLAHCEDIKPRYLARRLNLFFDMNSSLSSCYSLEMAFREVGTAKILYGMAMGLLGKLIGKPGEFYRVTGRMVAAIDDCTGTLPPFDKHVVLAPAYPRQVCDEIKQATGLDVAVVDANDLGKVDVLAISDKARASEVVEALKPNPQGNANEMTPIVVIRGRKEYVEAQTRALEEKEETEAPTI
ncbi:coenzyme F420-0:L-glutamate ligase [bacterium]|nr:coenzyme F420-0:L-glutamate ligase [bacterium]